MKYTLNISQKIAISFGILTLIAILFTYATLQNIKQNTELSDKIINEERASEKLLSELSAIIKESTLLSKSWAYIERNSNTYDKKRLQAIHTSLYPFFRNQLLKLEHSWEKNERETFSIITAQIEDTLFKQQKRLMLTLSDYDSYSEKVNSKLVKRLISDKGSIQSISNKIVKRISILQDNFAKSTTYAKQNLEKENQKTKRLLIISVIVLIITSIGFTYSIIVLFVHPIYKVRQLLTDLSQGILSKTIESKRKDDIGEIIIKLNDLTTNLRQTAEFTLELGKGNYNADFKTLSKNDVLRNSLLELRNSLESATNEAEERRKKEEIQNWITNGLANFADILRQNTDDFSTVGTNILRYLVDYMKINQGGIFVYNDDDPTNPYLDLVAVYAYNREKFAEKQISPGEGLVGTCLVEKETIYLKEVPDSYLEITSGLGKANPRNILIVPLKSDDHVLGVIELASFKNIETHEIEFVEKIGESIASALQTVRMNGETQKLLIKSKQQAEAMKSQEEEMRQNIEELQATQEEAARKETQLENELSQSQIEIEILKQKLEEYNL